MVFARRRSTMTEGAQVSGLIIFDSVELLRRRHLRTGSGTPFGEQAGLEDA